MTRFGLAPLNDWKGTVASLGKDQADAEEIERELSRKIAVQRRYTPSKADTSMDAKVQDALDHGRDVYVEFPTEGTAKSNWKLGAAGKLDARYHALAETYSPFASRLIVVPHHEPDSDRASGSPADFRAFHARVAGIFRATNPAFVIAANQTNNALHTAKPHGTWTPDPATFDLFGLDGYNHGGKTWRTFESLFAEGRDYASSLDRGFYVGETGCVEGKPGQKADWYDEQVVTLTIWGDVVAVMNTHHNTGKGPNFCVTTSASSEAAFLRLSESAIFAE